MALPATDDPSKTTLVSGVDVVITASRNGAHPKEADELIDFLMQPKVMTAYCKAQVAIPTLQGLTNNDPALTGVQSYINSGKIVGFTDHQFIPAIPLGAAAADVPAQRQRESVPRRPRLRLGQGRQAPDLGNRSA